MCSAYTGAGPFRLKENRFFNQLHGSRIIGVHRISETLSLTALPMLDLFPDDKEIRYRAARKD